MSTSLLWFRRDLRLHDHPALLAAAESDEVLGVFVLDPRLLGPSGTPRMTFLADCLRDLDRSMGDRLLVLHGDPVTVVPELARRVGAAQVHVSADYGVYGATRDAAVAEALADDIALVSTGSPYAVAPGRIRKPDGSNYAVFTPYFRGWSEHGWRKPAAEPKSLRWKDPARMRGRISMQDLAARMGLRASADGPELPASGETAALQVWRDFLDGPVGDYETERDRPDHQGTSRISPFLKWGCVHPRTLLADLAGRRGDGAASHRREMAWREFYADLVHHQPDSVRWSINPVIDRLEWDSGELADEHFSAWQQGRTGYPYIDAGMRQLLAEGWMHNRVRMGVASFLIKDLHLPWQRGARHFMQHLVDGDAASNSHGWQWAAGAGPQASPFFRIFHPVTQGERHDPAGDYVRRYVPELRGVAGKAVHTPWLLPDGPPAGYPMPIVDHKEERAEALRRFAAREQR